MRIFFKSIVWSQNNTFNIAGVSSYVEVPTKGTNYQLERGRNSFVRRLISEIFNNP